MLLSRSTHPDDTDIVFFIGMCISEVTLGVGKSISLNICKLDP